METPVFIEYCPHPVTAYSRGRIKDYVYPYYIYYPTVTEGGGGGGQYPKCILSMWQGAGRLKGNAKAIDIWRLETTLIFVRL